MTDDGDAKLLRMAGEIAQFFRHQGDAAPAATAHHMKQFWPPTMRQRFMEIAPGDDDAMARVVAALKALG